MVETTKTESAMHLANQLIAKTPTEVANIVSNEQTSHLEDTKMAETTTRNIFNTTPATGYSDGLLGGMGGGVGGFLLGALLARGTGLFGNQEGGAAVTQQILSQDLGDIKADVATSALETQKAVAASNMDINQTLFNQSGNIQSQIAAGALNNANNFAHTNQYTVSGLARVNDALAAGQINIKDAINSGVITTLQGDASILSAAASNHAAIEKTAAEIALGVERAGNSAVNATLAAANQAALQNAALQGLIDRSTFVTANKISEDGEKTRALINRINEDTLNRQLATAQNEIIELRHDSRLNTRTREMEVNVTNNINQNQAQAQTQAQLQTLGNAVSVLAGEIQRNSQSIVNLGNMGAGAGTQSAANTRVY